MPRGTFAALLAALIVIGTSLKTFASDGAAISDFSPDVLNRVSRSVVKVRAGDEWHTGFVFGSPRYVLTAYTVANAASTLEVVGADQRKYETRVVAWSEQDDLALLELPVASLAPPLEPATEPPWAPEPIVVLYEPAEPDPDSAEAKAWDVPVAMSGHIGRLHPKAFDVDVALWGRPGDSGAPVVTRTGKVLGILSYRVPEKRRVLATRLEVAQRLFAVRGRQGDFSRTYPARGFWGLYVTPLDTTLGNTPWVAVGAGVDFGMRYRWFTLELAEGVYQSAFQPSTTSTRLESTNRLGFDLAVEIEGDAWRHSSFFIGPAAELNIDTIRSADLANGGVITDTSTHVSARPALVFGFGGGIFMIRAVVSKEYRLDFGLIWGREQ